MQQWCWQNQGCRIVDNLFDIAVVLCNTLLEGRQIVLVLNLVKGRYSARSAVCFVKWVHLILHFLSFVHEATTTVKAMNNNTFFMLNLLVYLIDKEYFILVLSIAKYSWIF